MPAKYTVRDAFNLDDSDVIGEVSGTIISLFAPLKNDNGSLQNGKIRGDDGFEGKITFADNPQNEKTAKGKRVTISSVKSEKHGWLGVKMKDGGKHGKGIWVTSTASIVFEGEQPQTKSEYRKQEDYKEEPKTDPLPDVKPADKPRTQAAPPPSIKPVRWHVENLADLFATCVALVNEKVMTVACQGDETPDAKLEIAQAYATSLFIQCDRQGHTYAWNKDAITLPPIPPPERWREAVLHKGEYKGKTLADLPVERLMELFNYYDSSHNNTPLAECVYRAVEELNLLKAKEAETNQELTDEELAAQPDIPF